MELARRDLTVAADAVQALARGGDPDDPELEWVGAYLVAEFLATVRAVFTKR